MPVAAGSAWQAIGTGRRAGMAPVWCILLSLAAVLPAAGAELTVPGQFATIQAAINNAASGDTVLVAPGSYTENLSLRAGINVRGRELARTFLAPAGTAATVTISSIDDVVFANFTLTDATVGIAVTDSTEVTIASTVFDGATTSGVIADAASGVDIVNNVFVGNQRALVRGSADVSVVNNIFAGNTVTVITGTIDQPIGGDAGIEFNCFFDNDDLVDTGFGTDFQIGNPSFVDSTASDFHLESGSPCIDSGTGTDVIDGTVADIGAYGGDFADARPYPVPQPTASDASAATPPPFAIALSWEANGSYLVSDAANPGSYKVYYDQDASGSPYGGTDAGGGTQPSPINVGNVTTYTLAALTPTVAVPSTPELLSATPANQAVTLTWSPVSGVTGYRVHYDAASTNEAEVDVGNVTHASVTGLDNGASYRFAVAALSQPTYYIAVTAVDSTPANNESVLSPERAIRIGAISESALSNELAATPEEVIPFPNLEDEGGCFIATAAYGADWAPQVLALREFRDRYLLRHAAGRAFVRGYYAWSPAAADWLRTHAGLRPVARVALLPAVTLALFMNAATPMAKSGIVLLLLAGVHAVWWRRRSRTGRVARC